MNIPAELKYTKDHEWVKLEGDIATIGITEFAQSELGDIVYVEVETVGETMAQEEVFGSVEAVKTVSDLFLPMSGEIIEFNEALEANPELVNNDPYGEGMGEYMAEVEMEIAKYLSLGQRMDWPEEVKQYVADTIRWKAWHMIVGETPRRGGKRRRTSKLRRPRK